jgi:signal peptidase I
MKKKLFTVIALILPIIYIILYQLILLPKYLKYSETINIIFLFILTIITILVLGFNRENIGKKNYIKKDAILEILRDLVMYFVISYGIGFFIGYQMNAYALNFKSILNNICIPILFSILIEIYRYVLIKEYSKKKNYIYSKKKYLIYLITIVITAFDVFLHIKISNITSSTILFKTTTQVILPIISKNILLSYITYYIGYRETIIYRLIMDIYFYIIPIIPSFGECFDSIINILFPLIILKRIDSIINEDDVEILTPTDEKEKLFTILDIPILVLIISFICLLSGKFKFSLLGVGSESMYPSINKYDSVIIKKVDNEESIKIGDIIAYNDYNKNLIIIHRVIDINKSKNKIYFTTKGDANNKADSIDINFKNILGVVKVRIPYLAYPSIYVKELLEVK